MLPTEEQHTIIHYSVILPLVKKAFEKDRETVTKSVRIKEPYLAAIEEALLLLHKDLRLLKRIHQQQKIQVFLIEVSETFSTYGYVCHRHEGKNRYVNANLKSQTGHCMLHYLRGSCILKNLADSLEVRVQ